MSLFCVSIAFPLRFRKTNTIIARTKVRAQILRITKRRVCAVHAAVKLILFFTQLGDHAAVPTVAGTKAVDISVAFGLVRKSVVGAARVNDR